MFHLHWVLYIHIHTLSELQHNLLCLRWLLEMYCYAQIKLGDTMSQDATYIIYWTWLDINCEVLFSAVLIDLV